MDLLLWQIPQSCHSCLSLSSASCKGGIIFTLHFLLFILLSLFLIWIDVTDIKHCHIFAIFAFISFRSHSTVWARSYPILVNLCHCLLLPIFIIIFVFSFIQTITKVIVFFHSFISVFILFWLPISLSSSSCASLFVCPSVASSDSYSTCSPSSPRMHSWIEL